MAEPIKKKQAPVATPVTETAAPADVPAAPAPSGEMSAPTSVRTLAHLADVLPHLADDLVHVQEVTSVALNAALDDLPEEQKKAFSAYLARQSARKPGMHLASQSSTPPALKMYHGTGNDPSRPDDCPEGSWYIPERTVCVQEAQAKRFGLPTAVPVYLLGVYEGNLKWKAKVEGEEGGSGAPECSSLDAQRGSEYGDCSRCPYKPWTKGVENGCQQQLTLLVALADCSGVYVIQLQKTAMSAVQPFVRKKLKNWDAPWAFQLLLSAEKKQEGTKKWYLPKVTVGEPTTPELSAFFELLSRKYEFQVYYPALAALYRREPKAVETPRDEPKSDLDAAARMLLDQTNNI